MTKNPSVTVMIPTFNRMDDLRHALNEASKIDYPGVDVLVVDDGSSDGLAVRQLAEASGVRYLRTPRNVGLIAARNFGMAACTSTYVVNLDDDSWFKQPDGLAQAINFMERNLDIAVLALNIETASCVDWHNSAVPSVVPFYTGCGNIYRRLDVVACGPYAEGFLRQGEEADRAIRLYSAGKRVVSAPAIGVFHAQSPANRNSMKAVSLEAANYLKRELLRSPVLLLPYGIGRAAVYAVARRKLIDWKLYCSAFGGVRGLMQLSKQRKGVSVRSYLTWHLMAWRFHRRRGREADYLRRYGLERPAVQ